MEMTINDMLQKAAENQKKQIPFVLATVVQGAEKSPGRTGFKMICYQNGKSEGTVGGGELERLVLEKCKDIFRTQKSELITYNLTQSENGIGMLCGGVAQVFLEFYPAQKRAFLFGAGHLCRSMTPILKMLDFHVVIIDDRSEYANPEKIPQGDEFFDMDYQEFLPQFQPNSNDAIIIFTHGHAHDFEILDSICANNLSAKYIGMIGSKTKVKQAVDKIKAQNYQHNLIDTIFAPIGLNIGKTTTQEIAIAIAAELLAVYNGVKEIGFLSKKK
jgi:xanthine dehydrogenase accessory factor